MGKRDNYIDYRSSYSPGRQKKSGGFILAVLILLIMAAGIGVAAYNLSKKVIGDKKTPDELAELVTDKINNQNINAQVTEAPLTTATPTVTPTPTPFVEPGYNDPYLDGFVDFRDPLKNIVATGYDISKIIPVGREFEPKGVYMGNVGLDSALMDRVEWIAGFTELNTVMVNVKDDYGRLTYDMQCEAADENGMKLRVGDSGSIGNVKTFVDTLHSQGIYVIARICCYRESDKGYFPLLEKHPDWFLYTKSGELYRDGNNFAWLDPYNEEVCKYLADIAAQAALDGFDEICFDYVRVTSYYNASINYGEKAKEIPICDRIASNVRYFCNRLKPLGVYVSGCVYGMSIHTGENDSVGQNYTELAKYFDYICPMIYPSHYSKGFAGFDNPNDYPFELVKYEVKVSNQKLEALREEWSGHIAKVRPWLQCFMFGGENDTYVKVRLEVSGCNEENCYSWILWNSGCNYEQDYFLTQEEEAVVNAQRY